MNSPYYEYLYAFEIIAGLLAGSTISAATSLNLLIVMHAAAKFSIVREKLKSLKSDDINIKDHLANCVRLHQDAILYTFHQLTHQKFFSISSKLFMFKQIRRSR